MFEQLKKAAIEISNANSKTKEVANIVRKSNLQIDDSVEEGIIHKIKEVAVKLNGNIGAVDSGLLAEEMYGVDLIVCRGAGVLFKYNNGRLKDTVYYPEPFPKPKYKVKIGLDEQEINIFRSLFRLKNEIDVAINLVDKFNPNLIFMDGSLVPLSQDKPPSDSELFNDYIEVIESYKKLYALCDEKNCLLVGIIKDSRGRRVLDSLSEVKDLHTSDRVFLNYLLNENERTSVLTLFGKTKRNPIMRDFGKWVNKLKLFYLKSVKNDGAMRVEFLSNSKYNFDEIASIIHSLSAINQNYAYPAILIEVDLRAMLDPKEIERMKKTLQMFSSNEIIPLKRNRRPFR